MDKLLSQIKYVVRPQNFALPSQFEMRSSSIKSEWRGFSFGEIQIVEAYGYAYAERHSLHIEQICGPLLLKYKNKQYFRPACIAPTLNFPGMDLERHWQGLQRVRHLAVYPETVERFTHHPFRTDLFTMSEKTQPVVEQLLQAFFLDIQAGYPSGALLGETLLSALVRLLFSSNMELIEEKDCKGLSSDKFRRTVEFIEANLTKSLSLEDLARESSLSVRQVFRMSQDKIGMSPYQYIITRRVDRAKKLIESTRLNFEEIATQSGFAHAAHMANAFRKTLNATPSQFCNRPK